MLETNAELALRDIARRLTLLMQQVGEGEAVDTELLGRLDALSTQIFIKYKAGYQITPEELGLMTDLVSLLEMRTTLIYKNPPEG